MRSGAPHAVQQCLKLSSSLLEELKLAASLPSRVLGASPQSSSPAVGSPEEPHSQHWRTATDRGLEGSAGSLASTSGRETSLHVGLLRALSRHAPSVHLHGRSGARSCQASQYPAGSAGWQRCYSSNNADGGRRAGSSVRGPGDASDALSLDTQQRPRLQQVVPTPGGPNPNTLLLRDFIQNSLYHPTKGYFNSPTPPVGTLHNPINYWKIYCRDEFNIVINKRYKDLQTCFLTPAELFSPHYGACIARHMVEHRKHHLQAEGTPLLIYEIGGGNGTLARDVLDWLRTNRPQDYAMCTYNCIEISSVLAGHQYDRVVKEGGHGKHFALLHGSGLDPATWGERDWRHSFVLMMEVLDNLPHDRVYRARQSDPWLQTVVGPGAPDAAIEEGPWSEHLEPLSDPLLERCLKSIYRPMSNEEVMDARLNRVLDFILAREVQASSPGETVFVPSASCALMELMHSLRPNHSIIAADFDRLPDVQVAGRNAPLIAQKVAGTNIDHGTLYVPWGTADIFFPTDFDALCRMYQGAAQHVWGADGEAALGEVNAEHFRQGAVIKRYREMFNTATICAFNPMVDDFINARFFLGDSKGRYPAGQAPPVKARSGPGAKQLSGLGVKARIPAAPASKTQQLKQKPPPEPVLGGKRVKGAGAPAAGGLGGQQQTAPATAGSQPPGGITPRSGGSGIPDGDGAANKQ